MFVIPLPLPPPEDAVVAAAADDEVVKAAAAADFVWSGAKTELIEAIEAA
jgi:hypothetical protein